MNQSNDPASPEHIERELRKKEVPVLELLGGEEGETAKETRKE